MHKLKNMLMKKLDKFADYYADKELKDIGPAAIEFMTKATETLENISTIEAMEEYGDEYMDEMSGYPRRSRRTGRYMSRDDGMSGKRDAYGRSRSYDDNYDTEYSRDGNKRMFMAQLEDTVRTSRNEAEREAAKKLLREMEGTN